MVGQNGYIFSNIFSASREIQPAIPVIQCYDWDKIDLAKYNRCLQVELSDIQGLPPNTTSKIDSLLIHVTNAIKKAADVSVPSKRIKQKRHKHSIWSPKISKCVKENKAAFWELKNAKTEADKVILKAKCKETKSRLRSSQRKEHAMQRIDEYNTIMKASSEDEVLMYKMIRRHRNTSKTMQSDLLVDGELVTNPDEVRSVWADHFEKLATPQDDEVFNDKFRSEIDSSVAAIKVISTYLAQETTDPFSADEVRSAVSRLKKKKASDLENLCAEHIILGACCSTPVLVMLFNSILELSYIPTSFKEGVVVPVPKKGKDHCHTDNYRGITITSIIGKVLEHAIQYRLRNQIEHKQSKQQRGFTKGSSSTNAALILTEAIAEAKDNNRELFVASLDAKKAFDVVYQNAMLYKLFFEGLDPSLWNLMYDQYQDASSKVKWNGSLSRAFNLEQGVRQGSVLSTDCYKVFIDGLLKSLEKSSVGAKISNIFAGSPTCADDVLLIAECMSDLQFMLQVVNNYAADHRYIIHPIIEHCLDLQLQDTT